MQQKQKKKKGTKIKIMEARSGVGNLEYCTDRVESKNYYKVKKKKAKKEKRSYTCNRDLNLLPAYTVLIYLNNNW